MSASAAGVRAGGAYVEIFARDGAFQQAMVRVENRLKTTGAAMRRVGTNLVLGGAAIGAPMVLAARQAAQFQDALLGMQAAAGLGAGDVARLEAEAIKLSKAMGIDPARIATAFLELTKAGMSVEQVLDGAGKSAVEFAKVSGVDMAEAAVFMKVAMNVFGVSATEAVDTLSAAADASETSIAAMVESFALVGSAGKTFDQSLFDVSQGLAALARYGVRGEEAGTGIKTMLMRLTSPADSAKEALARVGLTVGSFRDANGNLLPLVQIIDVLAKKMAVVDKVTRDQILGDVFGDRGIRVVGAFLDMGVDGFGKLADQMEGNLPVSQKFQIMMSGISGQFEKLYAGTQRLAISFAKSLGGGIGMAVDAIVWCMDAFGMLLERFPLLGALAAGVALGMVTIGAAAIVAGVAMIGLGSVISGVAKLIPLLASPWLITAATIAVAIGGILAIAYQLSPAFAREVDGMMMAIGRLDFASAWEIMSLNFAIALTEMAKGTDQTLRWLYGAFAAAGSYIGDILVEGLDRFMGIFGLDIISLQAQLQTLGAYFRAAFDWDFAATGLADAIAGIEAEAQRSRNMLPTAASRSEFRRERRTREADERQQSADAASAGWDGTLEELRGDLDRVHERLRGKQAQRSSSIKRSEFRPQMEGFAPPDDGKGGKKKGGAGSGIGQTIGTFSLGSGLGVGPDLFKLEDSSAQIAVNTGVAANALQQMLENGGGVVDVAEGMAAVPEGLPAGAAAVVNPAAFEAAAGAAVAGAAAAAETGVAPAQMSPGFAALLEGLQKLAGLHEKGNSILGRIEEKLPALADSFA